MALLPKQRATLAVVTEDLPGRSAVSWANLAGRIADGDKAAEAEFAERFHGRVRVFATARLHDSDTALDISQETVLAVLQALRRGQVQDLEKLPAFVLGTATNLINNLHRKRARSREAAGNMPDPPGTDDPGIAVLAIERTALLRESFRRLSAIDQRILQLTLAEGLTPREIAPLVGLTAKTVRNRKCRAVDAVAADIEAQGRIHQPGYIRKNH